jgi:hypothetical protein
VDDWKSTQQRRIAQFHMLHVYRFCLHTVAERTNDYGSWPRSHGGVYAIDYNIVKNQLVFMKTDKIGLDFLVHRKLVRLI